MEIKLSADDEARIAGIASRARTDPAGWVIDTLRRALDDDDRSRADAQADQGRVRRSGRSRRRDGSRLHSQPRRSPRQPELERRQSAQDVYILTHSVPSMWAA